MLSFCKLILLSGILALSCYRPALAQTKSGKITYGRQLAPETVVEAKQLPAAMAGKDSLHASVQGEVLNVCQVKGCWMDIRLTDNTHMKVRFRNYGFFVPKNLSGKTVIMQGTAYQEIVSVADQQHYLKDAGKSETEIKAITKPKKELTFIADGVRLK